MSKPTGDHPGRAGLLVLGLATFALMGAVLALFGPSLPGIQRDFGLEPGEAALVISIQAAGSAVGIGLVYLYGMRVPPRLSLALMGLGAAGIATMAGWGPVLLSALTFGAGYGVAAAVFNPRILAAFGPRGPSMLSLINTVFGLGAILAPIAFVALGAEIRLAFGGAALLLAIVFAAGAWLGGGPAEPAAPTAIPGPKPALRIDWPILGFGAVGVGMESALIGLGPSALIAAGAGEAAASGLLSVFFIAFVAARGVLVLFADRLPPFAIYQGGMGLATLAAIGVVLVAPGPFFVLLGFATGLFFPSFFVTATKAMGADPRVAPVALTAGLVGAVSLPLVLGRLMGGFGPLGFFWLVLALTGTVLVLALVVGRRRR
ncbi:MFS transporter [Pseudogemmobacter sonorensis]|uniref:MFS transporter n=1 Tax=Pseudogemmobacter sonorensis TaxID=2989681 RepID=UPI0036748730